MFILRMINPEEEYSQINTMLGEKYYVINKNFHEKQFKELTDREFKNFCIEDLYGYIGNTYDLLIPLFKNRTYYVMTDGGKTFENISYIEKK